MMRPQEPHQDSAMGRVLIAMRREPDRIWERDETAIIAVSGDAPEQAVTNLLARGFVERVRNRNYRLISNPK